MVDYNLIEELRLDDAAAERMLRDAFGETVAKGDMSTLLKRRASIIGSALRHRTPDQKGEIAAGLLEHVWPKLPARKLK